MTSKTYSRREFLAASAALAAGTALHLKATPTPAPAESIIDLHQHVEYRGRTDAQLLTHPRAMGVTTTILLPAGRPVKRPSTHDGVANGLQAKAAGNEACYRYAQEHSPRKEFFWGACEVPDLDDAVPEIEKWLKKGAVIIGELKFGVECDSPEMQKIYVLARAYNVPVLMHWQHGMYNYGFDRFHTMLEKYPQVNFIGHAQTWWANIDKGYKNWTDLYPKGAVEAGGLTDRYLRDYPNMFGDLSAGSGLGALTRDEEHTRAFFDRHQDKLIYGSDCADPVGPPDDCQGAKTIAVVRRLAKNKAVERKLLFGNAQKLLRIL